MPMWDHNGGYTRLYQMWDHDGSYHEIIRAWDHDGSYHYVFCRSVTLTNNVGSAEKSHSAAVDAGYSDYNNDFWTGTLTNGNRYYIRGQASRWGSFTAGGASVVQFIDASTTQIASGTNNTGHLVRAINAASCKVRHHWTGSTSAGASAGCTGKIFMIVNIKPIEDVVGTRTADQMWSLFGSAVWYSNKTIYNVL